MPIGSSMGAYYDDEHHQAAEEWKSQFDDNLANPDNLPYKLGESPSSLTNDRNNMDPLVMQSQKNQNKDPALIYNDQGDVVDYDMPKMAPMSPLSHTLSPLPQDLSPMPLLQQQSMKNQMPFPNNVDPNTNFDSRFGNLPPSGIMNDLKKPGDPTPPLVRRINDVTTDPEEDRMDYSDGFNTPIGGDLSKETANYYKWVGEMKGKTGRDVDNDRYDYDIQGAYKDGAAPTDDTGHWPDTYKKPNHPTFSDQSKYNDIDVQFPGEDKPFRTQGGHWDKDDDGKDTFTPGSTNFIYRNPQEMIDYFKKNEPNVKLILPGQ